MTLADRELQRAHRNDREPPGHRPMSKIWIWIVAAIVIAAVVRFVLPPR